MAVGSSFCSAPVKYVARGGWGRMWAGPGSPGAGMNTKRLSACRVQGGGGGGYEAGGLGALILKGAGGVARLMD